MAAAYCIYHGPDGLTRIATRTAAMADTVAEVMAARGASVVGAGDAGVSRFDTVAFSVASAEEAEAARVHCEARGFNIRVLSEETGSPVGAAVAVSMDETVTRADVLGLVSALSECSGVASGGGALVGWGWEGAVGRVRWGGWGGEGAVGRVR